MSQKLPLVLSLLLLTVNCASIVHQTTQYVPVKSQPEGAAITVSCGGVSNDPKLVSPATVTLHRKAHHCSLKLTKEGFKPKELSFARAVSGWYFGNVLVGGIVGLIVDAANGAMWNRTPSVIDVTLEPEEDGSSK